MDFLILYEHTKRELENACLLKCELERRGYKVKIDYFMSLSVLFSSPKVLIVPHLYDDFQVSFLVKNRNKKHLSIVDLQYEQVLEESEDSIRHHTPSGQAKNAYHSAWGDVQVNRYLNGGISPSHICKTGNISMDLNYPAFNAFFYTREEIAEEFQIPSGKKWIMMLANFTLSNRTEEETAAQGEFCGIRQLYLDKRYYMIQSQDEILKWFECFLEDHQDYILIYRPHPAERLDEKVKRIAKKQKRFYINNAYSVRQWIRVADVFFTYDSTSLIDVYYSKKYCGILRPIDVPEIITAECMMGAEELKMYDEMETAILKYDSKEFPVPDDMIRSFYGEWDDGKAYVRIADMCETALKDNKFYYHYKNSPLPMKQWVKQFGRYLFCTVGKYIPISRYMYFFIRSNKFEKLMKEEQNEIYPSARTIKWYCKRFENIIGKNKKEVK